ncbi:MAG: metal-dependent hydrolase [Pseudomonadota bacterium]
MKLTWLGHSSFRVEVADSVVLVDPFLKGNPAFEASGLDWAAATAGATHVALTHGHDDHVGDTVEICQTYGATLVAVYELALHLNGQGVEKFQPAGAGGTIMDGDVKFSLTDAVHSSSSNGVYLGNACGLIIRSAIERDGMPVLYHMGDTDVFPGMSLIAELYKPTVGIVPIGDRFTMGARTAAFACQTFFKFKHIVPCHYGTFPIIDPDASKFTGAMDGQPVHVPAIGEAVDVTN